VFIHDCISKVVFTEELSELVPVHGITAGKNVLCDLGKVAYLKNKKSHYANLSVY
jgi:hypothetical protein